MGSELSLALLTTIREAVASRAGSTPSLNVSPFPSCTRYQDAKTQSAMYAKEERFIVSCSCCTALESLLVLPEKVTTMTAGVR